ncbi:MAG: hypothetical protein NTW14_14200 [bacterium]|nr:hypothetical protein [bacterium]
MSDDPPKFIVDQDLFPLCKALRLLGFDALGGGGAQIHDTVRGAVEEHRIWVRRKIHGLPLQYGVRYFLVENAQLSCQLKEIIEYYALTTLFRPFTRCLKCNRLLEEATAAEIEVKTPPAVRSLHTTFYSCPDCHRIYWPGSHVEHIMQKFTSWGIQTRSDSHVGG